MTQKPAAELPPHCSSPRASLRRLAVALVTCAVLAGCGRAEEQAFERARATDTVVAWEDFLRQHPEGDPALQARARLNELYEDREWQRAEAANTVAGYQQYLRSYPNGRLANEALVRIANLNLAQTPVDTPPEGASTAADAAVALPPPDPERVEPPVPAAAAKSPVATPKPAPKPAAAPAPKPAPKPEAKPEPKPAPKPAPTPAAPKPAPKPEPKPAPPKATPAAKPAPAAPRLAPPPGKGDRGSWSVQLGAFSRGRAAAEAQWAILTAKAPGVIRGLSPDISSPASGTGLHKLRITGLSEARARAVCSGVAAVGQPCVVTAPR